MIVSGELVLLGTKVGQTKLPRQAFIKASKSEAFSFLLRKLPICSNRKIPEALNVLSISAPVSTEIMVKESITSTAERTNEVEKEQEGEKVSSLCLTEKGLDLHGGSLVMANTDNFQEESFSQCVQFCMEAAPELNHVLISYYNALIVGDKVNCSNFFLPFLFDFKESQFRLSLFNQSPSLPISAGNTLLFN